MSPDLNPIEHLWKELKHAVWRRHPSNLRQLEQFAHKEWANVFLSAILGRFSCVFWVIILLEDP